MSAAGWKLSDDRGLRDCQRNGLSNKVALFNKVADSHKEKQMINPFSDWDGATHRRKLDKMDASYGKPVEGSNTERRGKAAQASVDNEMKTLCQMINDCGCVLEDSTAWITFGELFQGDREIIVFDMVERDSDENAFMEHFREGNLVD